LYWFSFFKRFDMDDDNTGGTDRNDHQDDVRVDGATIDGTGWHWPTVPGRPPSRPRQNSYTFRILTPAAYALGIDPAATLHITWQRRRLAQGYKIQVKDADTGIEVWQFGNQRALMIDVPAGTLARSKSYTIKVWAIVGTYRSGGTPQLVPADNTRTFNTLLTVPTNLAPVGTLTTLTPTMTCDAVVKAVRYKVKIYDAAGTTLLHTSIPLLLPSYPLGAGVLTDYATKKWTFTAYADSVCTAAYGVESAQVSIYKIELDDTLADGTVGGAYTGTITATGGTGPYTYAVTSGTLPAGLSLSSGGAVTGTPTTAATRAFTVTATDANGDTGSRAYSVTVAEDSVPESCPYDNNSPEFAIAAVLSGSSLRDIAAAGQSCLYARDSVPPLVECDFEAVYWTVSLGVGKWIADVAGDIDGVTYGSRFEKTTGATPAGAYTYVGPAQGVGGPITNAADTCVIT
jgi:hypothetical protein